MKHNKNDDDLNIPICVDLDGSLIAEDLLILSVMKLLKHKPWMLFALLSKMFKGKAALKRYIAGHVCIDPTIFHYNQNLLMWLHQQKKSGRRIILCTGSDSQYAHAVALHIAIFDEVFASNAELNLVGRNKAFFLSKKFGEHGYDYVGNSTKDIPVWQLCRKAILIAKDKRLATRICCTINVDLRFD